MKIARYRLLTVIALLVFRALSPVQAAAQDVATPTLGFTPASLNPLSRENPSDIDNIDLMTGALTLRIPLLRVGGRGTAGFTMYFTVNQPWAITRGMRLGVCVPSYLCSYTDEYYVSRGVTIGANTTFGAGSLTATHAGYDSEISCSWNPSGFDRMLTRLTFTAPDGAKTQLVDAAFNGEPKGINGDCTHGYSRGTVWYSTNGSGMTFISDAPISDQTTYGTSSPSGNLMMKDGTKYRIDNGIVTSIRDRNGNIITLSDLGDGRRLITDQLNRVIQVNTSGRYGTPTTIAFKGFGSENRTITLVDDSPALRPDFSSFHTIASAFPEIPNVQFPGQGVGTVTTVDHIILPDNRQYKLWFNNYGEIARVDLPTGGRVEYDYVGGTGAFPSGMFGASVGIYRRVAARRVYLNTSDSVPVGETKYTAVNDYSHDQIILVRQVIPGADTNLSYTKHYIYGSPVASYQQNPVDYSYWKDGLEWKTEVYDSDGASLIRSIERDFQPRVTQTYKYAGKTDPVAFDPQLRSEVTTLFDTSPNLVSQKTYSYDQYNNVTEVNEYGFGAGSPGPLLRRAHTNYLTTNPYQGNVNYATDTNIHIRNLPTEIDISDGNGALVSKTWLDYDRYDLYQLQDCPNIVQHDSAFGTGYGTRGNLVKKTMLPTLSPETYIDNFFQYDIAGNLAQTRDGLQNPTYFDFSDRFGSPDDEAQSNAGAPELAGGSSYAFPTKVTNALGHTTYTQYDYYLGKPVNVEDANGIVSNVAYDDALDRPTQSIRARYKVGASAPAERRQTTFTYDDANHVITTTSDLDAFNDNILTSKSYYDGLGRTWRSAGYEGSTWTITDTQFDALGLVSQVSNPYRADDPDSVAPPSGLWTKTLYDALGRVIDVETPDGAHVTTLYSGNQMTVFDPADKKRRSEIDALGRLIKVTEDPGGLDYDTSYSYDALGNLRLVAQGTQTRTFVYDSLSRLTSATNPESGTVTYVYDPNGNLTEKTDARGAKTTIAYDALNRPISKVYSGLTPEGTAAANATPRVDFYYDGYTGLPSGAPTWSGTPSKGGLIGVTYGGGSEGTYFKYDAAGRIVTNQQRQGTSNYITDYEYNLTGAVVREHRGGKAQTRRRIWMSYDVAGRPLSMQSGAYNSNGIEPFDLVRDISYTPFGGLQSETYGNGLIHSMSYNNRLQPIEIRLGIPDNLESVFRIDNIFGTADNVNGQDAEITLARNNGAVARIKYFISGTLQYSQTFQYDPIDRLRYAVEHKSGAYNDGSRAWYQTFDCDRYGNCGKNVANTSGNVANGALQLADFSEANNRITRAGFTYDSAGNLIAEPGKSYAYDAENRLVTATVEGIVTSQYVYDGNGHRVKKIVSGVATRFEYGAGGELIAERNDSNSIVTKDYFYNGGELLATTKTGTNGEYEYATADHLGSPRAWTDDSGNLIAGGRHDYLPFGEELFAGYGTRTADQGYAASAQQDEQRKQFTGYERDSETGLDFAQSRYYATSQGRFTKPDIVVGRQTNPQTLNLYAYTLNNPLKLVDPTGHAGDFYTPFQDPSAPGGQCGASVNGVLYDCVKPGDPAVNDPSITIETEPAYKPPSALVSIIPIIGSVQQADYNFNTGHPYWGAFYVGMAASDVFLVKSLATGGVKLGAGLGKLGWNYFAKETLEESTEVVVKNVLTETGVNVLRSEGDGGLHIALGLTENGRLFKFAEENGFKTYFDVSPTPLFDPDIFTNIMQRADSIHFNTEGFNFARFGQWAHRDGQLWALRGYSTVTNYELREVLTTPAFKAKLFIH